MTFRLEVNAQIMLSYTLLKRGRDAVAGQNHIVSFYNKASLSCTRGTDLLGGDFISVQIDWTVKYNSA